MFFDKPGKPTKLKKVVYLTASVVLGLLLSLILHALIEINYLHWALSQNHDVRYYGGCALPPLLQGILWILGAVGGFFMGKSWWRIVYVDRKWAKKRW
ncbi:MAG: hypothetical protein NTY12_02205 [Candidatus Falkowbacteria bacterium]|nr:hypothetical protein [Candidatus Falkowbacteria bacterium]